MSDERRKHLIETYVPKDPPGNAPVDPMTPPPFAPLRGGAPGSPLSLPPAPEPKPETMPRDKNRNP